MEIIEIKLSFFPQGKRIEIYVDGRKCLNIIQF
jgi:hypothetical protein